MRSERELRTEGLLQIRKSLRENFLGVVDIEFGKESSRKSIRNESDACRNENIIIPVISEEESQFYKNVNLSMVSIIY